MLVKLTASPVSWLESLSPARVLFFPSFPPFLEGPAIYVPGLGKMKIFGHYLVAIITLHAVGRPKGMPGRPGAIETLYPRNLITGQLGNRPESARLGGNIIYYAPVPRRGKVSALMSGIIRGYGEISPNDVPTHIRRILVHLFHYLLGMLGLLPLPLLL